MQPPSSGNPFEAALSDFRAGDLPSARARVDSILARDPGNARALHLAGEIAARGGELDLAAERLAAASAASPSPEVLASLARVRWRLGDTRSAADSARQSLAARPGFMPALLVAAFCDHASGNASGFRQAISATGLPEADPMTVEFTFQALVENVRDGRRVFASASIEPHGTTSLSLTVVTCSVDEQKLARCTAALRTALAPGFRHLPIRAPRSIAQAYNRALSDASTDAIVFVHDDVEILSPRLDSLISRALARADIVGIAGTGSLTGPTLGWSGQRELRGWLVHGDSASATWDFSALSLRGGLQRGMQGLDGCFIAARTAGARAIGFDAGTFDAFHFYDLDFSLRAHRAGLEVAVDTDILLAHSSRGRLGPSWEEQASRFNAKFAPIGNAPAQPNHFHAARLSGADESLRLHVELNGFCAALGTREG